MDPAIYQEVKLWAGIGQWIFNALVAAYLWFARKQTATNKAVSGAYARIEQTEKSIIRINGELSGLPNQRQLETLGENIRSLTSELGETKGRLEGLNRVADLMNEFLINQGGKR